MIRYCVDNMAVCLDLLQNDNLFTVSSTIIYFNAFLCFQKGLNFRRIYLFRIKLNAHSYRVRLLLYYI